MAVKIVEHSKAEDIALQYTPVIYQQWESGRDFLTSIILKDLNDSNAAAAMLAAMATPTLYYKVTEDDTWTYVFVMTYHPFDWSNSRVGLIRKLDSHRHDTESFCFRIAKTTGWKRRKGRMDVATVSHKYFHFKRNWDGYLFIESQGHGITPLESHHVKHRGHNYIIYQAFSLVDWSCLTVAEYQKYKNAFNKEGVDMVNQQYCASLKRRYNDSNSPYGLHKPGDLWWNPDIVFRQAERMNKL